MSDEELDVLKDIRTNTSTTATRISTTNTKLDSIAAQLTELQGQIVDVRNKVSDVKVVRFYVDGHPVGKPTNAVMESTAKEFATLYNAGYRVIANLGTEDNWVTLVMGKYPAPNKAK